MIKEDMEGLKIALFSLFGLFPYFFLALLLFYLGKWFLDISTPEIHDQNELKEKDNPAFGLLFVGYLLGLGFALAGALSNIGSLWYANLINIGISGIATILLMRLSLGLGLLVMLPKQKLSQIISTDKNISASFALASLMVANGLAISGIMGGRSSSVLMMLLDILLYWVESQLFLLLSWYMYKAISRFNVKDGLLTKPSLAAGISIGGYYIALGIIFAAAFKNAGSAINGFELLTNFIIVIIGLIILALARMLTSIVLVKKAALGKELITDRNIALGSVSALGFVAIAILYSALVYTQVL